MFKKIQLAFKAFCKAFKEEKQALAFLEGPSARSTTNESYSHLRLLSLLQQEGRLIDFLQEDLSAYSDAQVGAAIRKVHKDCGKTLEEFVTLRPEMQEAEGSAVVVPEGYDATSIKVIGKVKGQPPYQAIVRHRGWRAQKLSLPKQVKETATAIICPAEVEVL